MGQAITKAILERLLSEPVESLGYELVDIDYSASGRGLLRVYIDLPGGITLDDCERVSRQLSAFLDVEDPIPGSYMLEVSSPGMDRRLRRPEHFRRFLGAEVKVELNAPKEGRRRFRGELKEAEEDHIVVEVDGVSWELPLEAIGTAKLVPDLGARH